MRPPARVSLALPVCLILLTLAFAATSRAQYWSLVDTVVINGVNVVDVNRGTVVPDQIVVIDKNRIVAAGSRKETHWPRNAPVVINGKGLYLIPGLWDMHVHLVFGAWFPLAEQVTLPLFVANGITGVRDMGSELETVQGWRNEIEGGRLLGPRIITSGPMSELKLRPSKRNSEARGTRKKTCHSRSREKKSASGIW